MRAITSVGGQAIFAKADVSVSDEVQAAVKAVGKWGKDPATAIALASDEARYVNGTTLVVDGGRLNTL